MRQIVTNDVDDEGNLRASKRPRYDMDMDISTQSTHESSSGVEDTRLGTADATQYRDLTQDPRQLSQSEDAARLKRNEIRRAHRYLQEHAEPELFQVNPLPSTWPTEKADMFGLTNNETSEEHMLSSHQVESRSSPTVPPFRTEPTASTRTIDLTSDGAASPRPNIQQIDSQHTDTLSLSISESAFDSPGRESVVDEQHNPEQAQVNMSRSRRARVAAYLAAREGTYSAWTDVSLVSAGDNHTEEEIEL